MVATCYLLGVSTRRMDKLVETLGITSLSKSQVSVMADTSLPAEGTRVARCSEICIRLASSLKAAADQDTLAFVVNSRSQRFPRLGAGAVDPCGGTILDDYSSCLTEMSNWTCVGHFI